MNKMKIDDPVGAVAVHGFAGIWVSDRCDQVVCGFAGIWVSDAPGRGCCRARVRGHMGKRRSGNEIDSFFSIKSK